MVDDLFPTTGGHVTSSNWMGTTRTYRQFAFAGTRGGRLWPAIVEKAYAKVIQKLIYCYRFDFNASFSLYFNSFYCNLSMFILHVNALVDVWWLC